MVKNKVNDESNRERFIRLASRRTQSVLDKLRILGNCSNKYMYEYYDEDVRKIFKTIENELRNIKNMFIPSNDIQKFSLKE